jgi:hypothetical protein
LKISRSTSMVDVESVAGLGKATLLTSDTYVYDGSICILLRLKAQLSAPITTWALLLLGGPLHDQRRSVGCLDVRSPDRPAPCQDPPICDLVDTAWCSSPRRHQHQCKLRGVKSERMQDQSGEIGNSMNGELHSNAGQKALDQSTDMLRSKRAKAHQAKGGYCTNNQGRRVTRRSKFAVVQGGSLGMVTRPPPPRVDGRRTTGRKREGIARDTHSELVPNENGLWSLDQMTGHMIMTRSVQAQVPSGSSHITCSCNRSPSRSRMRFRNVVSW